MLLSTLMMKRRSSPAATLNGSERHTTRRDDREPTSYRALDDEDLELLDRQLFREDAEAVDRRRDPLRR
jgi:hypothetical protein